MIKDILNKLPLEQRRQLMYAFEHQFAQHITLPEGKFIGVNVTAKNLKITESAGSWFYGEVKGESK